MKLETKFDIGDEVFIVVTDHVPVTVACQRCEGRGLLFTTSGKPVECDCNNGEVTNLKECKVSSKRKIKSLTFYDGEIEYELEHIVGSGWYEMKNEREVFKTNEEALEWAKVVNND